MTQQQFKHCFDTYFEAIRSYLYYRCGDEMLATDIAQEVFMKVWEKKPEFDENRVKGLLYKMAGNQFIDHVRKSKVANNYVEETKQITLQHESPEETLQYQELQTTYQTALAELPEKQRTVFLMSRMEDLTYKEIAERLSLSVKAVEKRMSTALAGLKQRMQLS